MHGNMGTMAIRRPTTICTFCQARQSLIGRRWLAKTAKKRLETKRVALRPEDDGFFLSDNTDGNGKQEVEGTGHVLPINDTVRQWRLHSPVDDLRDALLGFDALWRRKDLRLGVLRNLSNPWHEANVDRHSEDPSISKPQVRLPEANAALIPHAVFRKRVAEAFGSKEIRKILRAQLLRCEWPSEILRVVAVSMQHKVTAQNLAALPEPVMRALYRCRKNVSDPEVLKVINTIIWRFHLADIQPDKPLLQMGLKFAARARSLMACKKYLKMIQEAGIGMSPNVFRAVIAKMSIGFRGFGEIRNGRWRREQLKQVLKGFEDAAHLPPEQQYHLGSFLVRDDWKYLHGWIAVLSRCKDSETIWDEWEQWKQSSARLHPKKLESQSSEMTSRRRGDSWFVEQMAFTGDYAKAWKMLAETGLPFSDVKPYIRLRLLGGIEHATIWNEDVRNEMLRKYDAELSKIENALGVRWIPATSESADTLPEHGTEGSHEHSAASNENAHGRHELIGSQEEALEALSSDKWKVDSDHGFPYVSGEEALISQSEERTLHDAEEKGLAEEADSS